MADYQKVLFASIYLEGKADHWFQSHYENFDGLRWDAFAQDM